VGLLSVAISSNDNIRCERVVLLRFRFRFSFIRGVNFRGGVLEKNFQNLSSLLPRGSREELFKKVARADVLIVINTRTRTNERRKKQRSLIPTSLTTTREETATTTRG